MRMKRQRFILCGLLFKERIIVFLIAMFFDVSDVKCQSTIDSTVTRGIQFGAMYHGSVSFSAEYYTTLIWPRSSRTSWYSLGVQHVRTEPDRDRFLMKWSLYHNFFEHKNGTFAGGGVGLLPVLAEANALDLVRDLDKFVDNTNYILPLELFIGFGQFNLGY